MYITFTAFSQSSGSVDTPPNERKWLLLSATLPHDDKISLTEKQGQESGHRDGLHISGEFSLSAPGRNEYKSHAACEVV